MLFRSFVKGDGTTKQKADGRGKTVLGNAKATAEDSVCASNLSQTRQLYQMQKDSDDEFNPATLADVPGAKSVCFCPVGKEPYTLDAATGKIKCPHPGHGKY